MNPLNKSTKNSIIYLGLAILLLMSGQVISSASPTKQPSRTPPVAQLKATKTPTPTGIATIASKNTNTPTSTDTPTLEVTDTITPTPTKTVEVTPTDTVSPTITPTAASYIIPYPSAPLCPPPSNTEFHTLWNGVLGCHYDHEHGMNPFTPEVNAAFPDFDLYALLGNVGVGHTNLSSPMENTMKHGGFKWDVVLSVPCEVFEGAQHCVTAAVVEYHNFGDYSIEMETRNHTTASMVKVCNLTDVNDCGFMYVVQLQEYGQRVSQYQGELVPYPNNPIPAYAVGLGPYFTIDRWGTCVGCRPSVEFVRSLNANANSVWTSKATGIGERPQVSSLFRLLFRVRDNYQLLEWASALDGYPFNFTFVCGGATYNSVGCRYNNSTSKVHEVAGNIPAAWDNLAGFDINPVVGRITATGFVTRYGDLALDCIEPDTECHPIKLVDMFVGSYGGALPGAKISNPNSVSNPERDIYFCNGTVCNETVPGAVSSGWIGPNN